MDIEIVLPVIDLTGVLVMLLGLLILAPICISTVDLL